MDNIGRGMPWPKERQFNFLLSDKGGEIKEMVIIKGNCLIIFQYIYPSAIKIFYKPLELNKYRLSICQRIKTHIFYAFCIHLSKKHYFTQIYSDEAAILYSLY